MSREEFIHVLKEQYASDVREAYLDCQTERTIDYSRLEERLGLLLKNSKLNGLPYDEFLDVVKTEIADTWPFLSLNPQRQQAA